MQYFYHLKPNDMRGNVLYPFSTLIEKYPNLAKEYGKIYEGRENLLSKKIKQLDCSWQDVIFLSTVNPIKIFSALNALDLLDDHTSDILQFPITALKNKDFCIYEEYDNKEKFSSVKIADYKEDKSLSERTWSYFMECKKTEENPLIFYGVTHILLNGVIDIKEAKTIKYVSVK